MNTIRLTALLCVLSSLTHAAPLGTAFTYQGQLADAGQPAHGAYDFRFAIYDAASGGGLVAGPLTNSPVAVANGLFTVRLDFGLGVFNGDARWLEISVRTNGGAAFIPLTPRQFLTPAPYALYSAQAGAAANALGVAQGAISNANLAAGAVTSDKVAAGQVVKSLNGLTDAITLNPGANMKVSKVGNTIEVSAASDGTLRLGGLEPQGVGGRIVFGWPPAANTYISEGIDDGLFLVAPAGVGIGPGNLGIRVRSMTEATHPLTVRSPADTDNTARLIGRAGSFLYGAKLNFGDGDHVFVQEDLDDMLRIHADGRLALTGGNVGVGTTAPQQKLQVDEGDVLIRGPSNFAANTSATLWLGDANNYVQAVWGQGLRLGVWQGVNAMVIQNGGNIGIGTNTPQTKLHVAGTTRTSVLEITGGSDLAEPFEISDAAPVPDGAVVVIDDRHPGRLRVSTEAYDRRVAGVVSGAGRLKPGLVLSQSGVTDQGVLVALSGRVFVLADAADGAIQPGDQLTTSDTPGHARKVLDYELARGAVLGKAMSSLETGRGLVLVLVTLQ
ncbi:MAG: hypothetical protein IPM17_09385 [Verrucomicrobia bacterium]|nr:hypothetical protein [Verrucomicrobiota bacterium]